MQHTLLLHVGYGKTGSSALQSWLANNASCLAEQGFSYAIKDKDSIHYRISSGNGAPLNDFLAGLTDEEQVHQHYFSHQLPKTIISSETLSLTPESLVKLNGFCQKKHIKLKVIAYVRDLVDWTYSAYVQSVKRHCSLSSYTDFIKNEMGDFPHVSLANMMDEYCEDISFVHYNTWRNDVVLPFVRWAGIPLEAMTPLTNRRVNRSLTIDEIRVVQLFVKWRKRYFNDLEEFNISMLISDWLVNDFPHTESEISVSKEDIDYLRMKFGQSIEDFNCSMGEQSGFTLNCGDNIQTASVKVPTGSSDGKVNFDLFELVLGYVLSRTDVCNQLFRVVLLVEAYKLSSSLVERVLSEERWRPLRAIGLSLESLATLSPNQLLGLAPLFTRPRYELSGQDYILFRDAALALEGSSVDLALPLMEIASKGRPNGKLIKDKLKQYKSRVNK